MKKLGLLGKNISYSFSRNYFTNKFQNEFLTSIFSYDNYDIQKIDEFKEIIINEPNLIGLNVTIPYKEEIIPYLDELSEIAKNIEAVNTIKITSDKKLIGHNTDFYGFQKSLTPLLQNHHKKALILGTGGASKAIAYVLKSLEIDFLFVSRKQFNDTITYDQLNNSILTEYTIIINCTPLGTYPNIQDCPTIPYEFITSNHLVYDLIYNPEKTTFLAKAEEKGAIIKNGYEMLVLQAEKAWKIWNT
ncbi:MULTISPECIES: shikimate dehydrogenase family protein [Flavobacterium]|uniref:Shikimate dehydrogenase n=1 Tax=Flavobacterium columnare TaxID=996 RepID=A0AA94F493_9FLAO|nr:MULTISPECIES: shikimate dehydrogenase [Flavobacterium]AMA49149.1 shikimate dehydrogenase [Flavobacterium covae]AND64780.1 shikimate dehydrogenase [Flavobacterium covae]MCH4831079.1 shikimate dehydrogenase [Flavobacterium columnare]MCH4832979.1 shikimate dehydrogenase [Flavobacterium columnare]MCJ1806336.1 shikimate dehydrogenase [Flavobacterium covae]